jgi:hypothetical protein
MLTCICAAKVRKIVQFVRRNLQIICSCRSRLAAIATAQWHESSVATRYKTKKNIKKHLALKKIIYLCGILYCTIAVGIIQQKTKKG